MGVGDPTWHPTIPSATPKTRRKGRDRGLSWRQKSFDIMHSLTVTAGAEWWVRERYYRSGRAGWAGCAGWRCTGKSSFIVGSYVSIILTSSIQWSSHPSIDAPREGRKVTPAHPEVSLTRRRRRQWLRTVVVLGLAGVVTPPFPKQARSITTTASEASHCALQEGGSYVDECMDDGRKVHFGWNLLSLSLSSSLLCVCEYERVYAQHGWITIQSIHALLSSLCSAPLCTCLVLCNLLSSSFSFSNHSHCPIPFFSFAINVFLTCGLSVTCSLYTLLK